LLKELTGDTADMHAGLSKAANLRNAKLIGTLIFY
jgi:hypothetical protein